MYRIPNYKNTDIIVNTSIEGESIETKVRRMLNNNEQITDTAPLLYTERKDGVNPAYDIRTDRMEIALEASDLKHKVDTARREGKMKIVIDNDDKNKDGGTEPIQATIE